MIDDFFEIGMSVDIVNHIKVGKYSKVGAGSLVLKNIKEDELWYGRPAKHMESLSNKSG